jgi:hypothetical protein
MPKPEPQLDGFVTAWVAVVGDHKIDEEAATIMAELDNELSKKAMARNEHTTAVARRASNAGYDCAIVEKTMHRPGSLRVGAPSRVRSHSSPADAALDRRRHCG